uniref:2-methoxy-6-polyprenyl-1,4-benzoquinol methylase, mitochondrial n=1 Tax=Strigamia maritima TaxID=126957 RepID=T1J2K4_STRMM
MSALRSFRLLKPKCFNKNNLACLLCDKNRTFRHSESQQTHFGFETVSEREKAEKVHAVFENVASNYDLMNDAMSLGIHRLWKDYFISCLAPSRGTQLLDVAGGTGDIAFRFLNYVNNAKNSDQNIDHDLSYMKKRNPLRLDVEEGSSSSSSSFTSSDDEENTLHSTHAVICDINEAMLDVGKVRAKSLGYDEKQLSWIQGDAEKLPFDDNSFDVYTIAYGIRNVVHLDNVDLYYHALSEAYRVLKRGGRFVCLEFSHVDNSILRRAYDLYSFQVIPVLGQILARDWKSYQYLVESIRQFPNQEEFKTMVESVGFTSVTCENLSFGISAIHSGFKM